MERAAHRTMNSLLEVHSKFSHLLDIIGNTQLAAAPGSEVSNKVVESFGRLNEGK